MPYWWDNNSNERYWVEITNRKDVGADLHCPKSDESEESYWSYDLIKLLQPGDIVFHYYTPLKSFIGASIISMPLREINRVWIPHGTVGRSKAVSERIERSGWTLPIYKYVQSSNPLTLDQLLIPVEKDWVYEWINEKKLEIDRRKKAGEKNLETLVAAPLQRYGRRTGKNLLRGQQGYLAKMPVDFINRWQQLSALVDELSPEQEQVEAINQLLPSASSEEGAFKPKNAEDYIAIVKGGIQRRTRKHENLIARSAAFLKNRGAIVSNPHPIDLLLTAPIKVIFEGKVVFNQSHLHSIRQAVGQLHEYRYFLNHKDALLCILLDKQPGEELIKYVEHELKLLISWLTDDELQFGNISKTIFNYKT